MKFFILMLLSVMSLSAMADQDRTGFDFVTDLIPDEEASGPVVPKLKTFEVLEVKEFQDLKKSLSREGLLVEGPGVSGGGNLTVGEFLFLSRQLGLDEATVRFWQQNGRLDVVDVELRTTEGKAILVAHDRLLENLLISRPLWQKSSIEEKRRQIQMILQRLEDFRTQDSTIQ
jgi:hypothetical protein